MKNLLLIFFVCFSNFAFSQSTFNKSTLNDIQLFPIFTCITLINGAQPSCNKELSDLTSKQITSAILSLNQSITKASISIDNSHYINELEIIVFNDLLKNPIDTLQISLIRKTLKKSGKRYGLFVFNSGYSTGNKEIRKSSKSQKKYNISSQFYNKSDLYVVIYDLLKNQNVYKTFSTTNSNPINNKTIDKILKKGFRSFMN